MGFEIINRVLEELNLEEYKSRFNAESMDDKAMGAIVNSKNFCSIIQKIVPRRDHAFQIQNKLKELWPSSNEGESSSPGSRSSAAGSSPGSGSTDSLLTTTIAAHRKSVHLERSAEKSENQSPPAPVPGPSTSTNARLNGGAEAVGNGGGNSEFDSFQIPMTKAERTRTKSTKNKSSHLDSHGPTGSTQESRKKRRRLNTNKLPRLRGS